MKMMIITNRVIWPFLELKWYNRPAISLGTYADCSIIFYWARKKWTRQKPDKWTSLLQAAGYQRKNLCSKRIFTLPCSKLQGIIKFKEYWEWCCLVTRCFQWWSWRGLNPRPLTARYIKRQAVTLSLALPCLLLLEKREGKDFYIAVVCPCLTILLHIYFTVLFYVASATSRCAGLIFIDLEHRQLYCFHLLCRLSTPNRCLYILSLTLFPWWVITIPSLLFVVFSWSHMILIRWISRLPYPTNVTETVTGGASRSIQT